jgi:hypothetical protein
VNDGRDGPVLFAVVLRDDDRPGWLGGRIPTSSSSDDGDGGVGDAAWRRRPNCVALPLPGAAPPLRRGRHEGRRGGGKIGPACGAAA